MKLTGTGLCLVLNIAGGGVQLTGTGLCLVLNRAGVGRAVNWCWFVFGTEYSCV